MPRENAHVLSYGTKLRVEAGRPAEAVDPDGLVAWRLVWRRDALETARLRLPDGRHIRVETDAGEHPLFGRVDHLWVEGEDAPRGRFGAVHWSRPASIPPLDRPGALPPGAGTAVLNLLARLAAHVGTGPLRYHGPYPTAALFETLQASFAVLGDRDEALARFTAEFESTALAGRMLTVGVDFQPAPHEWLFVHPRLCVEARHGIERVFVDGQAYARGPGGPRRLRSDGEEIVAYIEIAGAPWVDLIRLRSDAQPRHEPAAVPTVDSPLVGMDLPAEVTAVLGEIMVSRAPAPMQRMLGRLWTKARLRFGDTGAAWATRHDGTIDVHAVLGERLESTDARGQLALLLQAVEPVAHRWAQAELAARAAAAGLDDASR